MRNHWIYFFSGVVSVRITGKGLERVINTLIKNEISIWNVKKHGRESMTFSLTLDDAKSLRHLIRGSQCRVEFLKRTGLPFMLKKMVKNSGFLAGSFLAIIILFLLSNMIWEINIEGADPATEYKIRKELDTLGVKRGKLQLLVAEPEAIQQSLTNRIDEITWVGVELKGTTYQLQVVEKTIPEEPEKLAPQNLVATKKAVIVDMFVEEGQPLVEIYDHVKPGQLLVSGEIGKEGETRSVSARGEILGETWYKTEVELPIQSSFQVYSGKEQRKHYIKIKDWSLPIWGFATHEFELFEMEREESSLRLRNWELPISYVEETYRESEKVTRTYSNKEAIEVAKEMARKDIKNTIPEDATIKGENVLHQSTRNGKVYLTMHFQVIENIAKSYPIIQGESE